MKSQDSTTVVAKASMEDKGSLNKLPWQIWVLERNKALRSSAEEGSVWASF
jgi:hypothetical protein